VFVKIMLNREKIPVLMEIECQFTLLFNCFAGLDGEEGWHSGESARLPPNRLMPANVKNN